MHIRDISLDHRGETGDTWHWFLQYILIEVLKMPSNNPEHQSNVKKNQALNMFPVIWLVAIFCIHTAVSDLRVLHSVSFSSTKCIGLLYLLVAVTGQYQGYHRHRLHAWMSRNPHLDDLHLLLCQLEFLQQMHYRSEHTRRRKEQIRAGFFSVYN